MNTSKENGVMASRGGAMAWTRRVSYACGWKP